jgi:hypothetical protein
VAEPEQGLPSAGAEAGHGDGLASPASSVLASPASEVPGVLASPASGVPDVLDVLPHPTMTAAATTHASTVLMVTPYSNVRTTPRMNARRPAPRVAPASEKNAKGVARALLKSVTCGWMIGVMRFYSLPLCAAFLAVACTSTSPATTVAVTTNAPAAAANHGTALAALETRDRIVRIFAERGELQVTVHDAAGELVADRVSLEGLRAIDPFLYEACTSAVVRASGPSAPRGAFLDARLYIDDVTHAAHSE